MEETRHWRFGVVSGVRQIQTLANQIQRKAKNTNAEYLGDMDTPKEEGQMFLARLKRDVETLLSTIQEAEKDLQ